MKGGFKLKIENLGGTKTRVLVPIGEMSDEEFQKRMDKVLTKIVKRLERKDKKS